MLFFKGRRLVEQMKLDPRPPVVDLLPETDFGGGKHQCVMKNVRGDGKYKLPGKDSSFTIEAWIKPDREVLKGNKHWMGRQFIKL